MMCGKCQPALALARSHILFSKRRRNGNSLDTLHFVFYYGSFCWTGPVRIHNHELYLPTVRATRILHALNVCTQLYELSLTVLWTGQGRMPQCGPTASRLAITPCTRHSMVVQGTHESFCQPTSSSLLDPGEDSLASKPVLVQELLHMRQPLTRPRTVSGVQAVPSQIRGQTLAYP